MSTLTVPGYTPAELETLAGMTPDALALVLRGVELALDNDPESVDLAVMAAQVRDEMDAR